MCFYGCRYPVWGAGVGCWGGAGVGGGLLVDIFAIFTLVLSMGAFTRRGTAGGSCGAVTGRRGILGGRLGGGTLGSTHGRTGGLAGRKFGAPVKGLPLSGRVRGT